jgi:hypothetical protein
MTPDQALRFVRYYGVALESARGKEPSLAERVAGDPIRGSWWSHPKGHQIFEITQKLRDSRTILVCGLADGRITYIHRRLWPYFIRLAHRFPLRALDQVREVHLPSGRHRRQDVAFPVWVPHSVMEASRALSEAEAVSEIRIWLDRYSVPGNAE